MPNIARPSTVSVSTPCSMTCSRTPCAELGAEYHQAEHGAEGRSSRVPFRRSDNGERGSLGLTGTMS